MRIYYWRPVCLKYSFNIKCYDTIYCNITYTYQIKNMPSIIVLHVLLEYFLVLLSTQAILGQIDIIK